MKTLNEKKGYGRAVRVLEEDYKLRESINGGDPSLQGLKLAINILKQYQGTGYPGEKKWRA